MKKLITVFAMGAMLAMASPAIAQEQVNLLAEKPIYTLGEPLTWSNGDASYTFITDDLQKLVAVPTNTSNVFLYPENGAINNEENQAKGAQVFYIDMEAVTSVGTVTTTWEGAAADSFNIYLTDDVPTEAVLSTTPTYSVSGLGQYTENTAVLNDGSKGRYLVFQVTKATNWGWGVKIRSISAYAPQADELTTFKVSPGIVVANQETPVNITVLNQFGLEMNMDNVSITVSDNAVYEGGKLTITSGTSATFTATAGDNSLTATVYAAVAPGVPAATSIKTPIYTNTVTDYNSSVEWTTAWNGGANNIGELTFADGEVAWQFGTTRCVFFNNKETTGGWTDAHLNPSANGWRNLCLDVFPAEGNEMTIKFEGAEGLSASNFSYTLNAGEWNTITLDVSMATNINNMSFTYAEGYATDILVANIYFSPAYIEGDETAPVLSDVEAVAGMTSIELTMTATDDLNEDVYFSISDGTKTYATSGKSGEAVTYTVTGLQPSTTYNLAITASDGKNVSEAKTLEVTTTGMPGAPAHNLEASHVLAVYSNAFGQTELPAFDAWGSTGTMGTTETEAETTVLLFGNYGGQWGGLVNLDMDITGANMLNIDIFGDAEDGSLTIAPVWQRYNDTPNKTIEVKAAQWNSYELPLADFGIEQYGNVVIQIALTNSTMTTFAVDNLFFSGDDTLTVVAGVDVQEPEFVDVYTLQGIRVMSGVKASEAASQLPAGIYIIGGKKVAVGAK